MLSSLRRYDLQGSIGFVFTLDNYAETYARPEFLVAVLNSLEYAIGGAGVAVVCGTALAWVVERTNVPWRGAFTILAAATYFVPGVLVAIAWNTLAHARIGSLNRLIQNVIPVTEGPLDVNTMGGLIWVFGSHLYPIVFLLMAAAFRSMDPALEEQAALSGARLVTIVRTVTLAVSRPAVISAVLIMLVRGLESFDVPLILGLPAKINVLTTEIWSTAALHRPPELGLSSALGVLLLALSILGVAFYRRATARAMAFSTISGRGYRPRRLDLGRWRWPVTALTVAFFVLTLVLPLLAVAWISLFPFIRQVSIDALARASFAQYAFVLTYPAIVDSFRNAIVNAALVASTVVALTSVIAWIVLRSRVPGRWLLDALAFAPIGVPGTIMGVSVLLVYLTLPIPLYGTLLLITVAHVTMFLPYGMRLASDALLRVHPQLEEASALSGATWTRSAWEILRPLMAPGLIAAWITILAASFRELSAAMFLQAPQTRLVSIVMYTTWQDGNATASAALGIVVLLVVLALAGIAMLAGRAVRVVL